MANSALGKGLSALIPQENLNEIDRGFIPNLDINKVKPNPYQPRLEMDDEKLRELADSIKTHGVIEPLIVTKAKDDNYELIAGERRLRAAKLAGVATVPVVVKEASPQQMLELAVVENVQRADLNPLEEGMAFEQLYKEFSLSHSEISQKVGLSRPAVANKIRLLQLPEEIKLGLLKGEIDEGHARAILGLTSADVMIQAFKMIVRDNLSVRAVEELVRRLNQGHKKEKQQGNHRIMDHKTIKIEEDLKQRFTTKLTLARSKRGGKIVIPFKDENELDSIYSKLLGK